MNKIIEQYKAMHDISDTEWHYLKHPEDRPLPDATAFKDGQHFLRTLYNQQHKEITIMPDYDADGVTSGIYAYYGLQVLGIGKQVNIYFPNADDGFGVSPTSVHKAVAQFPNTQVLLTTDNGTSAVEGVKTANALGLTVLITDHHEGDIEEPDALAIINPNRVGDPYPFKGLSGGHVIHKVLWTYMKQVCPDKQEALEMLAPLVGLSTVADVMPIQDENHSMVKQALALMNRDDLVNQLGGVIQRHPVLEPYANGLVALLNVLEQHNKAKRPFTENTFGWVMGPLMNTPRRLTNKPDLSFEMFLQPSWEDAVKHAHRLIELNEERKGIVQGSIDALEEMPTYQRFVAAPVAQSFKTTAGHGIVGIIAGRLSNTYKTPVVVFSEPNDDGLIQGSGRSPEGFHILDILKQIQCAAPTVMESFGGHAAACGVTIKESAWPIFNAYFEQFGAQQTTIYVEPEINAFPVTFPDPLLKPFGKAPDTIEDTHDAKVYIDAVIELESVAPFGQGFDPLQGVITIDLRSIQQQLMGRDKTHIKFKMAFVPFEVIIWSDAKRISESDDPYITIQFDFSINEWNGRVSLQGIGKEYVLHNELAGVTA